MSILLLKSVGYDWDNKMVVSSANRIGTDLYLTNLGKSLIKTRKSKGPKTEPRGTPRSTLAQVDVVVLSFSLYSVLSNYTAMPSTYLWKCVPCPPRVRISKQTISLYFA